MTADERRQLKANALLEAHEARDDLRAHRAKLDGMVDVLRMVVEAHDQGALDGNVGAAALRRMPAPDAVRSAYADLKAARVHAARAGKGRPDGGLASLDL